MSAFYFAAAMLLAFAAIRNIARVGQPIETDGPRIAISTVIMTFVIVLLVIAGLDRLS